LIHQGGRPRPRLPVGNSIQRGSGTNTILFSAISARRSLSVVENKLRASKRTVRSIVQDFLAESFHASTFAKPP